MNKRLTRYKHLRGRHDQRDHNRWPAGYVAQSYVPTGRRGDLMASRTSGQMGGGIQNTAQVMMMENRNPSFWQFMGIDQIPQEIQRALVGRAFESGARTQISGWGGRIQQVFGTPFGDRTSYYRAVSARQREQRKRNNERFKQSWRNRLFNYRATSGGSSDVIIMEAKSENEVSNDRDRAALKGHFICDKPRLLWED